MSDEKHDNGLTHQSLKLSGISYLLGDAAMFVSGMLAAGMQSGAQRSSSQMKATTGLLWGAGGLAMARYGNPSIDHQLDIFAHKLEAHLTRQGAVVTDDLRAQTPLLDKPNTLWNKTERFLYEHPSEILNAVYLVGAGTMLKGAVASNDKTRMMIGGLVGAGALGGLLIKEDKDAMKKAEHGTIVDKAVAFVTEKPLRVSSAFYLANNLFLIKDAMNDAKRFKSSASMLKPHHFSFLTAAAYICANVMLALSPRNQINSDQKNEGDVAQLEQVAANIIAAQPKQTQETLLRDVSAYMEKEKVTSLSAGEIYQQLSQRMANVDVQQAGWAAKEQARAVTAESLQRV